MKKGMCVLLAALLCLSLAACGTGRESAESVVETAIQAFQSVDEEKIAEYWGDGNTTVSESESPEDAEMTQQMIEAIAGKLTYAIASSTEDEDAGTATVTVDFTNIDMSTVIASWFGDMFSLAMQYAFLPEDQRPTDEELNQQYMDSLMSIIEENKDNTITNTADIELTLVDDNWQIVYSKENIDMMLGGMMSALSNISSGLNSATE